LRDQQCAGDPTAQQDIHSGQSSNPRARHIR
jgi:hypothetical protein